MTETIFSVNNFGLLRRASLYRKLNQIKYKIFEILFNWSSSQTHVNIKKISGKSCLEHLIRISKNEGRQIKRNKVCVLWDNYCSKCFHFSDFSVWKAQVMELKLNSNGKNEMLQDF